MLPPPPAVVQSDDDPEAAARLDRRGPKADMLRDCLLDFDEGLLLLHDKLLDHESLVKRLNAVRKRKTAIRRDGLRMTRR